MKNGIYNRKHINKKKMKVSSGGFQLYSQELYFYTKPLI